MKNHLGYLNILVIFILFILISTLGYFAINYLININSSDKTEHNQESKKDFVSYEQETVLIIDSLKREIENSNPKLLKSISKESNFVWWITEDGYSIVTNNTPSIGINLNPSTEMQKNLRMPTTTDYDEITKIVNNNMLKQGFKLNQKNSNSGIPDSMSDDSFYDYFQAYEKEGIKCVGIARSDFPPSYDMIYLEYTFSCTTDEKLNENYAIHVPFIELIINDREFLKMTSSISDRELLKMTSSLESLKKNTAIFEINIEDDKASARVGARRSGWNAYFYKENNAWKLINQGQAAPYCSDLEQKGIPKKYQGNCLK